MGCWRYTDSDWFFYTPSERACNVFYYLKSCGFFHTNFDYQIKRTNYHSYLLAYICEGRLSITSDGQTMIAEQGQVCFVDCHIPHEYHTIGHTRFLWLQVNGGDLAKIHEQMIEENSGFVFNLAGAGEVEKRLKEIILLFRNEQIINEAKMSNSIYSILAAMLDMGFDREENSRSSSLIETATQFMKEHLGEEISLKDVANSVNLSQYHFSRIFKKEYGYPPHEFLILTRLNRAKHLLITTDLPVKIIAEMVGYSGATNFTNAFTKRVGMSPVEFRKQPI